MAFHITDGILLKWMPEDGEHIAIIPEEVRVVSKSAFRYCKVLQEVIIPSTVERIERRAFKGTPNLRRLTIAAGTEICEDAFWEDDSEDDCSIEYLCIIPGSKNEITDWYSNRFSPEHVREVRIGEGIKAISNGQAFMDFSALKQVYFPESLEKIDGFKFCKSLEELNWPSHLKDIGKEAFAHCKGLQEIAVPDNVKVGDRAFIDCTALERVTLGKNIELGSSVFYGCEALKDPIFYGPGKKLIFHPSVGEEYHMPDDITSIECGAIQEHNRLRRVIWGKGATVVSPSTFSGYENLNCVEIPEGVTHLGNGAFSACKRLRNVTLPQSLVEIGPYTFGSCTALKQIDLPNQLQIINRSAFHGCTRLSELTIPASVIKIGNAAFESGPKKVIFLGDPQVIHGHPFGKPTQENCKKHIICAAAGTRIAEYAHDNGFRFETLGEAKAERNVSPSLNDATDIQAQTYVVPHDVTLVDEKTIKNKASLKKIVLPSSVIEIGGYAFRGCTSLCELTVPVPAEYHYDAFLGFDLKLGDRLKLILIPSDQCRDGVVPCRCFDYIMRVRTLEFAEGLIRIENGWKRYAEMQELILPDSLEEIGEGAFAGCAMESVKLPRKLKKVGNLAFRDCKDIVEVFLSRNTEIAEDAFKGCNDIEFIYYEDE